MGAYVETSLFKDFLTIIQVTQGCSIYAGLKIRLKGGNSSQLKLTLGPYMSQGVSALS